MALEMTTTVAYLHAVVARLESDPIDSAIPDLSDLIAPDGVRLLLAADPGTSRVISGEVVFDEPLAATALDSIVERRVDLSDGSARLLLEQPHDRSIPVTLAVPSRWLDESEPITHAILVRPDRHTAPNGLRYAMAVEDALAPIDLRAALRPKSLLIKLADALDGLDDVSAIRWCDDAARLFGTEPIPDRFEVGARRRCAALSITQARRLDDLAASSSSAARRRS